MWAPRGAQPFARPRVVPAPRAVPTAFSPQPAFAAGRRTVQQAGAAAAGPPPPLDAQAVEEIRAYIQERGGAVPLGKLSTDRPGLKKAQLEPHFFVGLPQGAVAQNCDYVVSLDGSIPAGSLMTGAGSVKRVQYSNAGIGELGGLHSHQLLALPSEEAPSEPKKKKQKKVQDPNAPPPPPLEVENVQAITAVLQGCGGSLPLGKLTTQFEGLKKAQLEPHFALVPDPRGPASGDFAVCLPGYEDTAHPPQSQQQLLALGGVDTLGGLSNLTGAASVEQPLKKKKQKKQKPPRDPDAPPPPALEISKVEEVAAYLQQHNGMARLGKLTTDFPGLKKAQLEPHFVVCGDPAVDLSVCLDASVAITNGLLAANW